MSGIVGIVKLDGAVVDGQWLQRLTDFMAVRGQDHRAVWRQGKVGFGHAALHTTIESYSECQPQSLEDRLWITADARIDGRAQLRSQLAAHGRRDLVTDAELILHAYDVWGQRCLDFLLGDFAFAIWDTRRQSLFCARDHFGVKPFYYAHLRDGFRFSNRLNGLRADPNVSGRLNQQAIGDFLLSGYNHDVSTTFFADIQRLPPAHFLELSSSGLRRQRYFVLPIEDPLRFRRADDYVDAFKQLMHQATDDRLRGGKAAILMSGGLDSTSVAATARKIFSARTTRRGLKAFTVVYDRLVRSDERQYAALTAKALDMPIEYLVADDYALFERCHCPALRTPEPVDHPLAAILHDHLKQVAAEYRVALSGEGGDAILQPSYFYCLGLLKQWRLGRFAADVGRFLYSHGGQLPPLGVRGALRRLVGSKHRQGLPLPPWLNGEFVARTGLRQRWNELTREPKMLHPLRPEAYRNLASPYWPYYFEGFDPGVSGFELEVRAPLFDRRIVEFALALPPLPWCVDKEILRVAMGGILPEAVRQRPKAPLASDPVTLLLGRAESAWIDGFVPEKILAEYVDRTKIPPLCDASDGSATADYYLKLLPLALNQWLKHLDRPLELAG